MRHIPNSLLQQGYLYDAVGNMTVLLDAQNSSQKQCFGYDELDRLLTARAGDNSCNNSVGNGEYGDESYTYDSSGRLASRTGMGTYAYDDTSHKNAVTSTSNNWAFQYDADGNMTRRDPAGSDYYDYAYDAENRLYQASKNGAVMAVFTYDGDGARVKSVMGGTTTGYVGSDFEMSGGMVTKYYLAGGGRIAMRVGNTLTYLFGDQFSSTSATYRMSDGNVVHQLYKPWGEVRYASASLATQFTYTGQYSYTDDITTPLVTEGFGFMYILNYRSAQNELVLAKSFRYDLGYI